MKRLSKLIIVWLLLTAVMYFAASSMFDSDIGFEENVAETKGTITAVFPEKHGSISFDYYVDGQKYSSVGGTNYGFPAVEAIRPGQQIVVFYDRRNPSVATSNDPRLAREQNRTVILNITAIAPIFLLLILVYKRFL